MWGRQSYWKGKACILMVIVIIVSIVVVEKQLHPIINIMARQKAHATVVRIVQQSVKEQMAKENIRDFMIIEKDDEGKITYMAPDTVKINQLSSQILLTIEESLSNMERQNIKIPLGAATGSKLFSSVGPSVSMDIIPVGVVEGEVSNSFTEAGINQTKHTVDMDISVAVNVAVPLDQFEMEVDVSLPICESIIVGPIPNTYMNIEGSGLLSAAFNHKNAVTE